MHVWYQLYKYSEKITPVEVERSSDSSIWIKGRRCAINTSYEVYYPSEDEAWAALVRRQTALVERLQGALEAEETRLEKIVKAYKAKQPVLAQGGQ